MKFSVLTLGCRANQADSCELERSLRAEGGEATNPAAADVVVVNTCTVTAAADQAARNAIRRIARLNPAARIIATGCYATRKPAEVQQLPGVQALVPNSAKSALPAALALHESPSEIPSGGISNPAYLGAAGNETPPEGILPGFGLSPGSRGRTAYPLRVQTGCDERCAYCIVPSTRGAGTSRSLGVLLDDVRLAAEAGFKELWITGVHLGSYGRDLQPPRSLLDLLEALETASAGTDLTFRLSSLEPMDCGEEILDAVAASPRFLPHLHLPLQHASDRVLAAMRRPYTLDRFRAAVEGIRLRMPDAAIGTDLIAGFPGETEAEFDRQAAYLRASPLTHVHVFAYSDRPGTAAVQMTPKVSAAEIRRRVTVLREIAADLNAAFIDRQLGRDRAALTLDDGTVALTDNYLKVQIPPGRRRNERVRVRVTSARPLSGEVVT
jgi:threonylcarbamoyladenosine tRNA methylthiotransferase MtaB